MWGDCCCDMDDRRMFTTVFYDGSLGQILERGLHPGRNNLSKIK